MWPAHCEDTDETGEVCSHSVGLSVGPSFSRLMLCWNSQKYGLCYCFSVFHFVFSILILKILLLFLPFEVISVAPIIYLIFFISLSLCKDNFNFSSFQNSFFKVFFLPDLTCFSFFLIFFILPMCIYVHISMRMLMHVCACLHEGQRSNSNAITTNCCTNMVY